MIAQAAGQLDRAHRILLESHLEHCTVCGEKLAALRALGGYYLANLPVAEPPDDLWQRLDARLDQEPPRAKRDPVVPLSASAWAELEAAPESLRWRRLPFSTARFAHLMPRDGNVDLLLVRLPGGKRFPRHCHLGDEAAVLLAGGYTDDAGHFETGDYTFYPAGSEHSPITDADATCWIITRVERGVRFRGLLGFLQRLAGGDQDAST